MAPSAHSTGDAPRWQELVSNPPDPSQIYLFLRYERADGAGLVLASCWLTADGWYSWDVAYYPWASSPQRFNNGIRYDTLTDMSYWLMLSLEHAAGPDAPSFPAPSFSGRLSDASQEGGEVTE